MNLSNTAIVLAWLGANNKLHGVRADGELIASWVQYTGAGMLRPECIQLVQSSSSKNQNNHATSLECFFTAEVRAIYNDTAMVNPGCANTILKVNGKDTPMSIRVNAIEYFENFVCYAVLPMHDDIKSINLDGHNLPTPKWSIQKVAVIGDTGCRQGASHGGLYQSCLNPSLWPFKRVSQSVYESKPDVIIHMGDYIYREGPCATFTDSNGNQDQIAGCKDDPYYSTEEPVVPENFGVWMADWFEPAKYLSKAAPLILVRGNHETCSRAGTGYFRYLHHGGDTKCADPYTESPHGIATQPWVVDFQDFQVGITDTSTPPNKSKNTTQAFADQLNLLGHYFERNNKAALFGAHYPYYGWGTYDDDITGDGGTQDICVNMMEASQLTYWGHMPPSFDVLLGSHIHLGSITSFEDDENGTRNPPQIVMGNSGTQFVALSEPPHDIFGLEVKQTEVMYQYGYIIGTLMRGEKLGKSAKGTRNRILGKGKSEWWLMEFKDEVGRNMVSCNLDLKDVKCINLGFDPWFEEDQNG